jgi:hypothetical protein
VTLAFNFAVTGSYLNSSGISQAVALYMRHLAPESSGAARLPVVPYLLQPLALDEWMFGSRQTRGIREPSGGSVIADNSTGAFDALTGVAFDGNQFAVLVAKFLNDEYVVGSYATYMRLVADNAEVTESRFTLLVRDMTFSLKKPALTSTYAGTNVLPAGVEGTPNDIKGTKKPKVYGIVPNMAPPCVNTSRLIYQVDVSGLRTGWALVARDQYVALTAGANYVSQVDMETTAPAAGQYRVWPAGGMFRLGSSPTGVVTADVTNPVAYIIPDVAPSPTTGNEIHALLSKIASDGGLPGALFMDATAYNALAIPVGGILITDDMTYLDACNQLAASINCSWWLDGFTVNMVPLKDVSVASPTFTLDKSLGHVLALKRVPTGDADRGKPIWRVTVQYGKVHRVMSESEVAGAVTQANRAYVKREYREVYAENATVLTQWPKAPELVVQSLMTTAADAQAEADRLLDRYEVNRDCFEAEVPMHLLFDPSGSLALATVVTLKHPRFGLSAGAPFQIIGRSIDLQRKTAVLTLWG